jgi:hypothetical protein
MSYNQIVQETLNNLKRQGVKFNIITPVGYKFELHNEVELLTGIRMLHFVAEIDGYGNIIAWGDEDEYQDNGICYNADGEEI